MGASEWINVILGGTTIASTIAALVTRHNWLEARRARREAEIVLFDETHSNLIELGTASSELTNALDDTLRLLDQARIDEAREQVKQCRACTCEIARGCEHAIRDARQMLAVEGD